MDLINRQAALGIVYFECDKWTGLAKTIEKEFNELPSVEAEPVRHGRWLDGNRLQSCSVCRYRGKKSWNYCPNCGADMRGEKDG